MGFPWLVEILVTIHWIPIVFWHLSRQVISAHLQIKRWLDLAQGWPADYLWASFSLILTTLRWIPALPPPPPPPPPPNLPPVGTCIGWCFVMFCHFSLLTEYKKCVTLSLVTFWILRSVSFIDCTILDATIRVFTHFKANLINSSEGE